MCHHVTYLPAKCKREAVGMYSKKPFPQFPLRASGFWTYLQYFSNFRKILTLTKTLPSQLLLLLLLLLTRSLSFQQYNQWVIGKCGVNAMHHLVAKATKQEHVFVKLLLALSIYWRSNHATLHAVRLSTYFLNCTAR